MDFNVRNWNLSFGKFWGEKMRNFAGFGRDLEFFWEKILNRIIF